MGKHNFSCEFVQTDNLKALLVFLPQILEFLVISHVECLWSVINHFHSMQLSKYTAAA